MNQQIIKKCFNKLDRKIKEDRISLKLAFENDLDYDLLPLSQEEREEATKVISNLGLDLDDFHLTGNSIYPFLYMKEFFYMNIVTLNEDYLKMNQIEERYNKSKEYAVKLLKMDEYSSFFSFVDKPIRMNAFEVFFGYIPIDEVYEIFRNVYVNMEYGFKDLDENFLKIVFKSRKYNEIWKESMKELIEKFPNQEVLTVYRGVGTLSQDVYEAYSWTLNEETARWFADRFDSNGDVYAGEVHIDDVLDYITSRNEEEILVIPNKIQNIRSV